MSERIAGARCAPSSAREEEMRATLARGDAEGLALRALSQASGIPRGTLAWWRYEIRRRDARRAGETGSDFIELVVGAAGVERREDVQEMEDADAPEALHFEIALRADRRVRVPVAFGLARLVRELEGC